jgi:cytochrome c-type biogenesis protein CcmE
MKRYGKFALLIGIIVGTLAMLAASGFNEAKSYYKTIPELQAMKDPMGKRIRVGGDVEAGSIVRVGKQVHFTMKQDDTRLKVIYNGSSPLPDTFRDGAQALADGKLGTDGVFQANQIQAKCASKYEAKPQQPGTKPVYQNQNKATM